MPRTQPGCSGCEPLTPHPLLFLSFILDLHLSLSLCLSLYPSSSTVQFTHPSHCVINEMCVGGGNLKGSDNVGLGDGLGFELKLNDSDLCLYLFVCMWLCVCLVVCVCVLGRRV